MRLISELTTPSSSSSMAVISPDAPDLETKRHKLSKLYHAAHCPCEDSTGTIYFCPTYKYCCAAKRLFQHMITCTQACDVPGCKQSRSVWKHYRKCLSEDCPLCSVVPTLYSSKQLHPRFKHHAKQHYQQQRTQKLLLSPSPSWDACSVMTIDTATSTSTAGTRSRSGKENNRPPRKRNKALLRAPPATSVARTPPRGDQHNWQHQHPSSISEHPSSFHDDQQPSLRASSLYQQQQQHPPEPLKPPLSPTKPLYALY